MNTIRVDGNDVLAVHYATKAARQFCISEGKPVLIEAMTYRYKKKTIYLLVIHAYNYKSIKYSIFFFFFSAGPHSTSDDSTLYRTSKEIALWNNVAPIQRFKQYIQSLGIWSKEQEDNLKINIKKEILDAFTEAEKKPKPHWKEMFTDTYFNMPDHIRYNLLNIIY